MKEKFAKLFESEKHGQVLVLLDTNADKDAPEVRFFVKPDGLGVCSAAVIFPDTDKGVDSAARLFEKVGPTEAESMAKQIIDSAEELTS